MDYIKALSFVFDSLFNKESIMQNSVTTTTILSSMQNMRVAPEVKTALAAIDLPEVQEIIKRLSHFNLAVCVPHMHTHDIDFAALPNDYVQVEEDCRVRWTSLDQLENLETSIPVAWRWVDDGINASSRCMAICSPNEKRGHQKTGHLPG